MMVDSVCYGTKFSRKMPLTRDKPLENNYTNNNDHSYLHKKFKKMASSIAVFPATPSKVGEIRDEVTAAPATCNSVFSNGTIAASHLELQKIRDQTKYYIQNEEKKLQINISEGNNRISVKCNIDQISGQTSSTDEFSNKTENLVNEFIRDSHNGGTGGRYVCPYCNLSCAKPSVLQKHIRAHTNERPYPCIPCGIAFKTKSNLYKHYRSRTHAARLQGSDVIPHPVDEEELSGESESDSSLSSYCNVDAVLDTSNIRNENIESARRSEYSSPETTNDRITPPNYTQIHTDDSRKTKTIYKPKFRAALYEENEEKDKTKKNISSNANFLTEHISKIISDNEAIVDVIETPLQKKYGKIKQIAESKQLLNSDLTPLNLTKNNSDSENSFRKRSHSESFPQNEHHKHPLNPEGSIIKDLLLKNRLNDLTSYSGDNIEGPVFICPLCQYIYQSADNLEIHRMYYCKGTLNNKYDNFVRSNSLNDKLTNCVKLSPPLTPPLRSKPDNLVIVKPESMDIIAPLPSPGPLLGNTRLVDTRSPSEFNKTCESLKLKPTVQSLRRKHDCTVPDPYNSLRIAENLSPRATDPYQQHKIRCIEATTTGLRSIEEISQHMRQNSTSLQMFGGEVKIVDHSGGTTTLRIEPSKNQLSPILTQPILSPSKMVTDAEASNVVVRSGLHSGGTMVHNPPTPKEIISTPQTPRISISNAKGCSSSKIHEKTLFQFPPFNAITAFNPLTLPLLSPSSPPNVPTKILHAGKLIPHVPGIPGPNTPGDYVGNRSVQKNCYNELLRNSVGQKTETTTTTQSSRTPHCSSKIDTVSNNRTHYSKVSHLDSEKENANLLKVETVQRIPVVPIIKVKSVDESNGFIKSLTFNQVKSTSSRQEALKRNAEGAPKLQNLTINHASARTKVSEKLNSNNVGKNVEPKPDSEIRHFNFENFITKAEIYNIQIQSSTDVQKNIDAHDMPLTSIPNERSETSYFQKSNTDKTSVNERKPKFLRPSTLPLKPGTFIPKKHHGITPNANTMPLVSPETPRPAKAYGQLYLNGNAYTYLGLKCSTKVFYCTINRPQPTYVPNQHFLSMYSNWQLFSELTPDPLGLSASSAMSLYDSRHRPQNVVVAPIKQDLMLTHSSQWDKNSKDCDQSMSPNNKRVDENKFPVSDNCLTTKKELAGGFESNEEYTYVRGRGRGRYVCLECGIRCNKPSMLKKHVRTHTDVRPYTCIHCAFSFKTKGNLTKHTKSKAHYKKCCELGINPNEGNDNDGGEMTQGGETDEDTESDGDEGNEGETESSDTEVGKSQLPEHEAAHCLLSLGNSRQLTSATPGLITSARPSTYPYAPQGAEKPTPELSPEKSHENRSAPVESKSDLNCEPIDLSKNDVKISPNIAEIPTARESSVLASLASNTAKLPQNHSQWSNGEPLLHTYLTERALYDSKIKQSQLTSSISKPKKVELEKSSYVENDKYSASVIANEEAKENLITCVTSPDTGKNDVIIKLSPTKVQNFVSDESSTNTENINKSARITSTNAENAKHVVSEYLKHARINLQIQSDNTNEHNITQICTEDPSQTDDVDSESDAIKLPCVDHDPVARKVVIGAGGVAFKVSKGKGFEGTSYSQGRLMEDGRRVCDFCNKTFSKPSQLRLHLNIHYMERPFRCSACAVSFRTRGHLQKHERSGSHHNKVSMTSTFGAATSLNPRPFRCSDCNIAFRIHGHLAKHLRSKMHVMRLECLFKLPFGTFTEIERAGVSLTDIDTTDCASSLASLQSLARTLHEKDPTKLEYREPNSSVVAAAVHRESSEDEDGSLTIEKICESDRDCDKTENSENQDTES